MNHVLHFFRAGCFGLIAALQVTSCLWANEEVYAKAIHSTVYIVGQEKSGSGVLVDRENRLIVTNEHVVAGEKNLTVFFPIELQGQIECDGEYYLRHAKKLGIRASIVATDSVRDIAILRLESLPEHSKAIEFGAPARPGQQVHSIGNPDSSDALWIYTAGYVRANYYKRLTDNRMQVVETSSPINPGDSGGPILDDSGKLVGLSQSYMTESRLVSNGIDISEITWFLNKVKSSPMDEMVEVTLLETDSTNSVPTEIRLGNLFTQHSPVPANQVK